MTDQPEDILRQGLKACSDYWEGVAKERDRLRSDLDVAVDTLESLRTYLNKMDYYADNLINRSLERIRGNK